MFFCEFPEISTNNFFIENIRATAFVLSFVNPRKKSEDFYSPVILIWNERKRKGQKQPPEVFY